MLDRAAESTASQDRHIYSRGRPTALAHKLQDYFKHRANVLNNTVKGHLMDLERATQAYEDLKIKLKMDIAPPMNKQTGEKAKIAYLTGIVNMLAKKHLKGVPYESDPQNLTTVTEGGAPLRTFARRFDGCVPSHVNPIGIWEIKEYYHTTTFGSRVADGVYVSLLDGMELEEIRVAAGKDIQHLLIIDAYFTWWIKGRSYLCRLIDMLHMGYIDEVLFGEEVLTRLPVILDDWATRYRARPVSP